MSYEKSQFEPYVPPLYTLSMIIPSRVGDVTLASTENLLSSISSEGQNFSLEIVGDGDGVSLMHRADRDDAVFRQMMQGHFPSANVVEVPLERDPLIPGPNDEAIACTLRVVGEPYLPIKTYESENIGADHGADPMAAVIGAHANLECDERLVTQILLKPLPRDWSEKYARHGLDGPGSHNEAMAFDEQRVESDSVETSSEGEGDANGWVRVLGVLAIVGMAGAIVVTWFQGLSVLAQVLTIISAVLVPVVTGVAGFVWWKRHNREEIVDDYVKPELAQTRIRQLAYKVDIRVVVLMSKEQGATERAQALLESVIEVFRGFSLPGGSRVVPGEMRRHTGQENPLAFTGVQPERGGPFAPFRRGRPLESVIGLREVASMWHLPTWQHRSPSTRRSPVTNLPPPREMRHLDGAYVGDSTAGPPVEIVFPEEITGRHQLVVGAPGMGKTTLIQHCIAHKIREKSLGKNDEAIIVVAPHSGLIDALLGLVPPALDDGVLLIDLADAERVPGINLLDVHLFPDRDRTADMIVRILRGGWETWGSRMQNILEHVVKSLHEANSDPDTPRDDQYTLLDGIRMLRERDFRREILEKVDDVFLKRYWRTEFDGMSSRLRNEAVAPVLTRLDFFGSSRRSRQILGQRRSTLDIGAAIENGDIVLVNCGQDVLGRDVGALLGGTVLNVIDTLIRQQGAKKKEDRRSVYLVVDEIQNMPGVDFRGMLAEVSKVGGALCLVTGSLAVLDGMSSGLANGMLSNIESLVVFKTSGNEARRLVSELGTVSVDDVVSLPAHHALVRATVAGQRPPVFSVRLRPPQERDTSRLRAVRALADAYTRSVDEVDEALAAEYGSAWDVGSDPAEGYTGVDSGVLFLDTYAVDRMNSPWPSVENRGRRDPSWDDASSSKSQEATVEDRLEQDDSSRRPRTARDSNIDRFEQNL